MVFVPYTNLDQLLQTWQNAGIFAVVIPFILIFAVVFAVLNKSEILGKNKGVQAVIAIALAFGALQFDFTTRLFYAEFFKNIGVGIVIILALLIFTGFMGFEGQDKGVWIMKLLAIIAGFIVFLVVLIRSYGNVTWLGSSFWSMYGGYIVLAVIVIGIILLVTIGGKKTP
ncbi:hypothetical protein HZA33_05095 [Candidatus Pacearchaeota archaeon]|nr:hypothetical protein [Candidatus Pacearchaeota archaeon]